MDLKRWLYRYRGVAVALPLVFAALWDKGETEDDFIVWPAGIVLFLLGMALRLWAQQHLRFRLKVPLRLTTTGPYAFVRNPIYIGNTLICLGATVCSELLWFVPVTLLWCAGLYSVVVRYEEARLLERYGDSYRNYLAAVSRWVPRRQPRGSLQFVNEHFRASLLAEIHCVLVLLPYVLKEAILYWAEH